MVAPDWSSQACTSSCGSRLNQVTRGDQSRWLTAIRRRSVSVSTAAAPSSRPAVTDSTRSPCTSTAAVATSAVRAAAWADWSRRCAAAPRANGSPGEGIGGRRHRLRLRRGSGRPGRGRGGGAPRRGGAAGAGAGCSHVGRGEPARSVSGGVHAGGGGDGAGVGDRRAPGGGGRRRRFGGDRLALLGALRCGPPRGLGAHRLGQQRVRHRSALRSPARCRGPAARVGSPTRCSIPPGSTPPGSVPPAPVGRRGRARPARAARGSDDGSGSGAGAEIGSDVVSSDVPQDMQNLEPDGLTAPQDEQSIGASPEGVGGSPA